METRKNILVCLFSVRNTISLSRLEENKILELRNSEFLMKFHNWGIFVLLSKDKISELRNSEILFSLKISSYEKLAASSQFDLTQFYDVIIHNSIF